MKEAIGPTTHSLRSRYSIGFNKSTTRDETVHNRHSITSTLADVQTTFSCLPLKPQNLQQTKLTAQVSSQCHHCIIHLWRTALLWLVSRSHQSRQLALPYVGSFSILQPQLLSLRLPHFHSLSLMTAIPLIVPNEPPQWVLLDLQGDISLRRTALGGSGSLPADRAQANAIHTYTNLELGVFKQHNVSQPARRTTGTHWTHHALRPLPSIVAHGVCWYVI